MRSNGQAQTKHPNGWPVHLLSGVPRAIGEGWFLVRGSIGRGLGSLLLPSLLPRGEARARLFDRGRPTIEGDFPARIREARILQEKLVGSLRLGPSNVGANIGNIGEILFRNVAPFTPCDLAVQL